MSNHNNNITHNGFMFSSPVFSFAVQSHTTTLSFERAKWCRELKVKMKI